MACNCYLRNPARKSCVHTFNAAAQSVPATLTSLAIGSPVTYTGVSLTAEANGVQVNTPGLYSFEADVVYTGAATTSSTSSDSTTTAAANNVVTVQLYNGTTALPCNKAQATVNGNATATLHVETSLVIDTVTEGNPTIGVGISGESGTVTFVSFTATKLA